MAVGSSNALREGLDLVAGAVAVSRRRPDQPLQWATVLSATPPRVALDDDPDGTPLDVASSGIGGLAAGWRVLVQVGRTPGRRRVTVVATPALPRPRRIVYDVPADTWAAGGVKIVTIPYGVTFDAVPGLSVEIMGGPGGSAYLTARLASGSSITTSQCDVQVWNTHPTSPQTTANPLPLVLTIIPVEA